MADAGNNENEHPVMDYEEHENTYKLFLDGSKYLTIICVALLIAMAFGFFAGGGLFGGIIAFIVLTIIGAIIL